MKDMSRGVWLGLIATIFSFLGSASANTKSSVGSHNCEKITSVDFDRSLKAAREKLRDEFKSTKASDPSVSFQIELPFKAAKDAVLVIESNKVQGPIYVGLLMVKLGAKAEVRLSPTLVKDGTFDTLTFFVLSRSEGRTCRWLNEEGFDYWKGAQTLKVRLLPEGYFDKAKLFRQFEIKAIQ